MPSLWDLLCVSRQHTFSTKNTTSTTPKKLRQHLSHHQHQHHQSLDDPVYYDPSSVEYYIQPRRSTDSQPLPPGSLVKHVIMLPAMSPNSSRNHRVRDLQRAHDTPYHDWHVEVRGPQPMVSPSRDLNLHGGDAPVLPLLKSQQSSAAVVSQPLSSGQQDLDDRDYGSGKKRHVKDIFAHVTQQNISGLHPLDISSASVLSSSSHHSDQHVVMTGLDASERSPVFTQCPDPRQNPWPMPISESGLSSVYQQLGQTSPFVQSSQPQQAGKRNVQPAMQCGQAYGYPPASWQSLGSKPSSSSKPQENMHQYSPRTVSDSTISSALFGNRIDDFVHDPGWNKAINRFAASPTTTNTTTTFSGEDKSYPRTAGRTQKTVSPTSPDGNVIFVVAAVDDDDAPPHSHFQNKQSSPRVERRGGSTSHSPKPASPQYQHIPEGSAAEDDGTFSKDVNTAQAVMNITETGVGSGQDFQTAFSSDDEVLY